MKKPKSSPAKAASTSFTTPKRRSGKAKSTPNKLGRSTPNSSAESSPQNLHDETYNHAPVDLNNLIVDEFLCSQDVVNSDVIWDCSSPRSRLVSAPGGSDVESLVKMFRTKPQETKPIPSAFSIISANFVKTSTVGGALTPRRTKRNARKKANATSAQAVMDQMQELWDMVQQSKKNGFGPSTAADVPQVSEEAEGAANNKSLVDDTAAEEDVVSQKDAANTVAEATATVESVADAVEDEDDYDQWLIGDDSILVAATQDIDVSSPARKCAKTPTRANGAQPPSVSRSAVRVANASSPTLRKTPSSASPLRRQEGRTTPKWNMSAIRKSPRLSALSLNRTPSPLRPSSAKTKRPAEQAPSVEVCSRSSSTDVLFDDEDELLDQICCTYEQQQQLDAKIVAATVASSPKTSTSSTITPVHSTTSTSRSGTVVSSVAVKTSTTLSSKIEAPKVMVSNSHLGTDSVGKIDQQKNGHDNVAVPAHPVASHRPTVSVSTVKQSSNSTTKPGFSSPLNATNQLKPGSTHTDSLQQPRVILERCTAVSVKAPLHGRGPSSSSAPVSTASMSMPCLNTKSRSERLSVGTVRHQSVEFKTPARTADAALDFDDDDSDLATPEVMSWLEEVESQPVQVKRCTPEEIAKKRAEALQRRRLREQESNKWKGRLRMSK
ncbi:hypothetical protein HPB49_002539 [Dermacentor silvarum]|uniref:Uncharacterized protein n=1 Tax=Dermacentor silvarum TaxID=543639 RepID=A0ACB8CCY8_DERSI|nr:hypothetical protein HPB49_002539 [Dermacentor silvarum]